MTQSISSQVTSAHAQACMVQSEKSIETEPVTTYNHAYSFNFEVPGSRCEDGTDITPDMLKEALLKRFNLLDSRDQLQKAIGCPWDTHKE